MPSVLVVSGGESCGVFMPLEGVDVKVANNEKRGSIPLKTIPEAEFLKYIRAAKCGHTHVAEALKVSIHIFFTMPWTFCSWKGEG
ncbi:uncharacterized protein LOC131014039 isoform X2 [Salvia miltiorrhiza]|uniref:uncharacterized protein LOC131014039 isoform X2 n=1 Tax=Salvia miltiorrhiza TaxID=226208 RepID=UPI0025AC1C5A|nr:uncharacterized protein LOC131014039 isoform X2 [Salvia miltiorrhiza]